jgi:radical SAM superfamily enzyme YgiQ (UPF0313 family)
MLIDPTMYPPTGLLYLAGAVDKLLPQHTVDIKCLGGYEVEDAASEVAGYDIVGMNIVSTYWPQAQELASRLSCQRVVAGGPHPTVATSEVVSSGLFSAVFRGQAERSFVQYLMDVERGLCEHVYESIPGPVDEIPMPRLEYGHADRGVIILSSRGCVNKCAFCSGRICFGGIQLHSPRRVVDEVERLAKAGKTRFRFLDDMVAISRKRMIEICAGIKPLNVRWSCHTRADRADIDLLRVMVDAGCYEVGVGVETFDQAVLDACGKNTTVEDNVNAITAIHEAGAEAHIYMIIGTPGETGKTADINIRYMDELRDKYSRVQFSTMMPYPGSPIWEDPEKFGVTIIDKDYAKYTQHQYVRKDNLITKMPLWSPVRIRGLSEEDQMANLAKMRDYIFGMDEYTNQRIPK